MLQKTVVKLLLMDNVLIFTVSYPFISIILLALTTIRINKSPPLFRCKTGWGQGHKFIEKLQRDLLQPQLMGSYRSWWHCIAEIDELARKIDQQAEFIFTGDMLRFAFPIVEAKKRSVLPRHSLSRNDFLFSGHQLLQSVPYVSARQINKQTHLLK
jgi:hypothetical protein